MVGLACFLKGHDGTALEAKVSLELLSELTDQTLEWQLHDQELSGFLVSTDLTEGDRIWPVAMGFLDSTSGWCTLPSCLGGELFLGALLPVDLRAVCSVLATANPKLGISVTS